MSIIKENIVNLEVDKIIPYARNPRKNDDVVDKIVASIKEFGFVVPILLNKENQVIDGHLRLKGAKILDIKKVPCIYADHLSENQQKAFRLLANKSVTWASWDEELLNLELSDLQDMDYDTNIIGFEDYELITKGDGWNDMNLDHIEAIDSEAPEVIRIECSKKDKKEVIEILQNMEMPDSVEVKT